MLRLVYALAVVVFIGIGKVLLAQTPSAPQDPQSFPAAAAQPEPGAAAFRITTREVAVDLIALHGRNQPVLDLTPAELQVFEGLAPVETSEKQKHGHPKKKSAEQEPRTPAEPGAITALHVIDPNDPLRDQNESRDGFQIARSCLERSTQHYRLTFRPGPEGWRSGYHRVTISTTREGVKLYYRHQYYVGITEGAPRPPFLPSEATKKLLLQAACYYPLVPPSILLRARLVDTGRTDVLRYSVAIDAESLSFLSLAGQSSAADAGTNRYIALDYAMCNFDSNGAPIGFFHVPVEKVLPSADYARALDRGFPHVLEIPAADIAVTRVVVRDRATGNLGAVDVDLPWPHSAQPMPAVPAAERTAFDLKTIEGWQNLDWAQDTGYNANRKHPMMWPPDGPIGSFGSIVRTARTFCGDVYELPKSSAMMPEFRDLDPIGSIYTSALDVPNQVFSNTSGIPGMTPRTNLFGIDYHGTFWVANPGEYKFLLMSDDGAIVRIDDKKVIDLDGLHYADAASGKIDLDAGQHTIEVPYYQGAVNSVALELWFKPPGAESWTIFDLNDFAQPTPDSTPTHR
jgi:hypothetical protein